jgi:hypothetical protein
MRAFARDIELDPARLSLLLRKKQGLSRLVATSISKKLSLSKLETDRFCESVDALHSRSKVRRRLAAIKLNKAQWGKTAPLSLDVFAV